MNCGLGLDSPVREALGGWLCFVGARKEEPDTPSTVDLSQDGTDYGDRIHDDDDIVDNGGVFPSHRNPDRARATPPRPPEEPVVEGVCIDCAEPYGHCTCGDRHRGLLPVACDSGLPGCSPIVCGDCMRCQNHCTCHCEKHSKVVRVGARKPKRTHGHRPPTTPRSSEFSTGALGCGRRGSVGTAATESNDSYQADLERYRNGTEIPTARASASTLPRSNVSGGNGHASAGAGTSPQQKRRQLQQRQRQRPTPPEVHGSRIQRQNQAYYDNGALKQVWRLTNKSQERGAF
ncbi:unnamed protein product [Pseudo-nitzschia multistriata]|uniref:Uncharacterized protein n=1 Tax=Pseudo-nitzschia multistriata TaxID=183589 RepID=A0A448YVH9_9STRA|nr:unnamed protein product [Pseudo-nitzschia multistriata]